MANKTDRAKGDAAKIDRAKSGLAKSGLAKVEAAQPEVENVVDPQEAAEQAGLRYVSDEEPGITRRKAGEGWTFVDPEGATITDEKVLERVRKLAVPPAYTDVWICARANGHIQATGRDAKGRKQYRYHAKFREVRDSTKYEHMLEFARGLPAIRETIEAHMNQRSMSRERVLATVVYLLETTLIRVGNDDYARANKSYGLTTLKNRHVDVTGGTIRFAFKGKSGKMWNLKVQDRRIARIVKQCQDIPGQELFQWYDDEGRRHDVTSQDVNDYLREITGRDVTAKDFRTWAGTVLAAMALHEFETFDSDAKAKKNVRAAIESVASRLGNTPTICRKCYVHPEIVHSYLEGGMLIDVKAKVETELRDNLGSLKPEEAAVLTLLETRLSRDLKDTLKAAAAAA